MGSGDIEEGGEAQEQDEMVIQELYDDAGPAKAKEQDEMVIQEPQCEMVTQEPYVDAEEAGEAAAPQAPNAGASPGVPHESVPIQGYIMYVLGLASLPLLIVGLLELSKVEPRYGWMWVGCGVSCYIGYLVESLKCSKTANYLRHIMSEVEFRDYIKRVQDTDPSIRFTIECYHYETRTETYKDSEGKTQTKTTVEKVVTHRAARGYGIRGVLDETLSPEQTLAMFHLLHDNDCNDQELSKKISKKSLVLLCHFPLVLHPASASCEQHYLEAMESFYRANTMDTHQSKGCDHVCDGHLEHVLVTLHGGTETSKDRPWWMSYWVFALAVVCFASVPYRLVLFRASQACEWPIMKHFSPLPLPQWPDPVPMRSRRRGTDAAARAFKALPRESSGAGGGGGAVRPDVVGATLNTDPVNVLEAVPQYWKNRDFGGSFDEKIRLAPEAIQFLQQLVDKTYVAKATRDRKGGSLPTRLKVVSALRMEDANMWRRYTAKAAEYAELPRPQLLRDLPGSGRAKTEAAVQLSEAGPLHVTSPGLNEVYLFHGTSPTGALGIGEHGFSMGKVGSNVGTMFGAGAYLAEACTKSDEYAQEDPGGVFAGKFAFLLCRVVLGNPFYITESNIPAIDEALATGRYQSVLGDREAAVQTFREFVVFEEAQIYPEYVVIYERQF